MKENYEQLLMQVIVFSEEEENCIKTSGEVQYDELTGDAYFEDYWD